MVIIWCVKLVFFFILCLVEKCMGWHVYLPDMRNPFPHHLRHWNLYKCIQVQLYSIWPMYVFILFLTIPLYVCWYLLSFVVSIVLVGYFQGHAVKRKFLMATITQSYQNVNRLWDNWSSCDFGWIQCLFYYLEVVFRAWALITDCCIITWERDLETGGEGVIP
jgi:hypothetical protein